MTYYTTLINLPTKLLQTAFPPDDELLPSSQDLVILVSTIAVFWSITFYILHKYLHPWAIRQQWLRDAMGREYDR
jgi:hypothetical protein